MLRGETTTRSALDPAALTATPRAHGVTRLRGEAAPWVVRDEGDVRKPHATAMEGAQPVKRLAGPGAVPGYRTLNAIGLGPARAGCCTTGCFPATPPASSARARTGARRSMR